MKRYHRSFALFLCICLTVLLGTVLPVKADMGPKPSIWVGFQGLPAGECYAAILTESGQFSIYQTQGIPGDIELKFKAYTDIDGYVLNGRLVNVTETKELNWTYMAPDTFKILLYSEAENRFYESPLLERYAFKSVYTAVPEHLALTVSSHLGKGGVVLGFAARLIVTVLIEVLIGLLFGLKSKYQLRVILITNLITQLLLNIALWKFGMPTVFLFYLMGFGICELVVFGIEAAVYASKLYDEEHSQKKLILYAFLANLASMLAGFYFSNAFPTLF